VPFRSEIVKSNSIYALLRPELHRFDPTSHRTIPILRGSDSNSEGGPAKAIPRRGSDALKSIKSPLKDEQLRASPSRPTVVPASCLIVGHGLETQRDWAAELAGIIGRG
jgi:hypothetical protein